MWILIIVAMTQGPQISGGTSTNIHSVANFKSKASCEAAAKAVGGNGTIGNAGPGSYGIIATCVEQ